jgi:predicted dehydrogenase
MITFALYTSLVADPAARMPGWWFDKGAGGGWLGAQGSHLVDQLHTWLGGVASLSATMSTVSPREGSADETYTVRFTMRNGVEGIMQATAAAWGPSVSMTRIAGTAGTLWLDGDTVWLADKDGQRRLTVPPEFELPSLPEDAIDPREMFSAYEIAPYTCLARYFRESIEGREHQGVVPAATFADGLAATLVLDAVRGSAANGGALTPVTA